MKIIRSPLNGFTMLPNELLQADCCLEPREVIVWAALQSLCREQSGNSYQSEHFSRQADVARFIGIKASALSRHLKNLKKCGALVESENNDWELAIPQITKAERKLIPSTGEGKESRYLESLIAFNDLG